MGHNTRGYSSMKFLDGTGKDRNSREYVTENRTRCDYCHWGLDCVELNPKGCKRFAMSITGNGDLRPENITVGFVGSTRGNRT